MVVIHYTGMESAESALERLTDPTPGFRVSAHYMITDDGTVLGLVPEDKTAWHAGRSAWAGRRNLNPCSIGIELAHPGRCQPRRGFPPRQITALIHLLNDIRSRHRIPDQHILGHFEIAPGRKSDPGPLFPWRELARAGHGFWPDFKNRGSIREDPQVLRRLLTQWGYDPRVPLKRLRAVVRMRYRPEGRAGQAGSGSIQPLLENLLKQRKTALH